MTLAFQDFQAVEIHAGTITAAEPFPEARKPAFKLTIDFGPAIGTRRSSAQITALYNPDDLVGRQVIAVTNLAPRQIGPFMSEVLVLGLSDAEGRISLLAPDHPVPNGARMH
ncbi:tRNA-binding protein [Sphingomonas kaistensis]|uniref:tRNA-binding protein n=1 Tax=Sphingomonas kaistensis TaxID=298708 RepID=A0ABZ2G085_9SPHN